MDYRKIVQQAIDLHVHIGPEIVPRKFTLPQLIAYEAGKLKGVGVKNHFFPTAAMDAGVAKSAKPFVIASVALNRYVGGFNADIVRASAELSKRPIIVWFPTVHAEKFLKSQQFEIPKEWIGEKRRTVLKLRSAKSIAALRIFDERGRIRKDVQAVLNAIEECGAILATGHLSWAESRELVRFAAEKVGIKKIIVTHPIYQQINMPIEIQKELAELGAFMEQCYSMHSIDGIPVAGIAKQIKAVGAENCILSSDVGQVFSKSPSESLIEFISLLERESITEKEIKRMLIENPNKLIG
jgi:hypothetical protein